MISTITLNKVRPLYVSEKELAHSEVFLKEVVFEKGKNYLIEAYSGKGKSSLLNFIYGNKIEYFGKITYCSSGKTGLSDIWKEKISYVFQDFKLFNELTLWENIQLKNCLTRHKTETQISHWLERIGMKGKEEQRVGTLSLGQRQRTAVLRALCQPFDFLLLDEPFSHLDTKTIQQLVALIEEECKQKKAGLILTSLGGEKKLWQFDEILSL